MSNKIGRFEILSELHHSDNSVVYKATDSQNEQTVALKTIQLEPLGEQAQHLVQTLLAESEASKSLNSHNLAVLYGAEQVDGVFCAAMEYVQGNSVATMLARKEGFSIWDLQDIARQSCQGLDHAHAKSVTHHTLEPAKIMVAWDGTVKILGFGTSVMGAFAAQASGKPPQTLHYMSPEQLRGDPLDARSNLFSLGAILYEMVTERKPFDAEDADQVRQGILETMPTSPRELNRKAHPVLSEVIMKALAKTPEERYQSGQEMIADLERCKESPAKAAAVKAASTAAARSSGSANAAVAKPEVRTAAGQTLAAKAQGASAPQPATLKKKAAAASVSSSGAQGLSEESPVMSSAVAAEPEIETPRIAVDPLMDENRKTGDSQGRRFSEISELPPLKEVYIAPPPPPAEEVEHQDRVRDAVFNKTQPEKPKVKAGEVAKNALGEVRKTPPKLFLYSIAGAVGIILLVIAGIAWHIHSANSEDDNGAAQAPATTAPAASAPAHSKPANPAPVQAPPAAAPATFQAAPETIPAESSAVTVRSKPGKTKKAKVAPPQAPAIVPGQLNVTSTPAGAQIQVDGQNNPGWITPYNLPGLTPGNHIVVITKPGFAPETRTLDIASGSKSFLQVQLASLSAVVVIASDPAGVEVWMDGKDTGKATPAQISVDKPGSHSFVFKKQGYLDETASANLQTGQTFRLAPTLKALGTTDEIKTGGKFKKLFGGSETAGMGVVSVKTQPKGAQIAVNNRVLDKPSPVEFYLNPGNYVVDITLPGFKSIHRVISVDKNGKIAIDENMDRE